MNVEELTKLVKEELYLENWFILKDKISKRTDSVQSTLRFSKIKNQADKQEISYNDTEVVTWFDSLHALYLAFDRTEDDYLKQNIIIFQEYCIPYSRKRADYLLLYDNKILILEFSFNKLDLEFNYETKLQQAIGYKELLSNILPKEIEIGTYTFLLEPEADENWHSLYIDGTNLPPNHYKIDDLANYIEKFFKKNLHLAYNSISQIEE
jgi:hypothetical protein